MIDSVNDEKVTSLQSERRSRKAKEMSRARVIISIQAPAQEVWEAIREFNRVEKFLPTVASCTVEGSGVGARRICTLQDGSNVFERLVTLDERNRVLRYSVTQSRLPFESYLGTVRVTDSGHDRCAIDWSSTFDPVGLPEAQVIAMIEDLYVQAIEGLEKLHRKASRRKLTP